jgi:hypothetical protein
MLGIECADDRETAVEGLYVIGTAGELGGRR